MKEVKIVLVTGSREWTDTAKIYAALQKHLGNEIQAILVHGDCPTGADAIANSWAQSQPGIAVDAQPANWERFGRSAGPRRNQAMVDRGADICLAFPKGQSRGTRHCMRAAEKAGIPVINYGDEL